MLAWENHSTEGGDICTGDPTGGRSSGDDGACSYAPAVKEMSDVGVRAQTIKSFVVEHDQATAGGGKPDYKGQVFLIDESSMAGNQIRRHCSRPLPAAADVQSRWGISTSLKRSTWARRLS